MLASCAPPSISTRTSCRRRRKSRRRGNDRWKGVVGAGAQGTGAHRARRWANCPERCAGAAAPCGDRAPPDAAIGQPAARRRLSAVRPSRCSTSTCSSRSSIPTTSITSLRTIGLPISDPPDGRPAPHGKRAGPCPQPREVRRCRQPPRRDSRASASCSATADITSSGRMRFRFATDGYSTRRLFAAIGRSAIFTCSGWRRRCRAASPRSIAAFPRAPWSALRVRRLPVIEELKA